MFKRLFDVFLALVLLILLSPVFLMLAAVLVVSMGFPAIFKQERVGYRNKMFFVYKFRTMNNTKDQQGDLLSDRARLTRLGRFLRKSSLDELPQLWNVLKGDMSFVGPRPLFVKYLPLYTDEQKQRHNVMPGITGWAQINGRNNVTWEKKFELDVWYANNRSFLLDVNILFQTFMKVVASKDVNRTGQATVEEFKGGSDCE